MAIATFLSDHPSGNVSVRSTRLTSAGRQAGFTLIELSIVLVIIGLIVGGILVGQDLIKAAEIRATVSQVEKFRTSANTFKLKYGYLPGDVPVGQASALGFFAFSGMYAGNSGFGDGNGRISGGNNTFGETFAFWRHLSDAQMIDGSYGTTASGIPLATSMGHPVTGDQYVYSGQWQYVLPPARIGRGNFFIIGSENSPSPGWGNALEITGLTDTDIGGAGVFDRLFAITPVELSEIDRKLDDGLPLSGNLHATDGGSDATPGGTCVTAASQYDVGATNGNVPNCQAVMKF